MARTFDAVDEMGRVVTGAAIIGASVPRIDGPLKTTGAAQYAADFHFDRLAHAVPVQSTIASGSIKRLDASAAEKMPGVLLVLHRGNLAPTDRLYRVVPNDFSATASEARENSPPESVPLTWRVCPVSPTSPITSSILSRGARSRRAK